MPAFCEMYIGVILSDFMYDNKLGTGSISDTMGLSFNGSDLIQQHRYIMNLPLFLGVAIAR